MRKLDISWRLYWTNKASLQQFFLFCLTSKKLKSTKMTKHMIVKNTLMHFPSAFSVHYRIQVIHKVCKMDNDGHYLVMLVYEMVTEKKSLYSLSVLLFLCMCGISTFKNSFKKSFWQEPKVETSWEQLSNHHQNYHVMSPAWTNKSKEIFLFVLSVLFIFERVCIWLFSLQLWLNSRADPGF